MVKAEHVNPFILSVCKVVKDVCMMDLTIGKPDVKKEECPEDASIIELGLVGATAGQGDPEYGASYGHWKSYPK